MEKGDPTIPQDPMISADDKMSDADREKLRGSEVVWENYKVQVKLPDVSAIPVEEGAHFQIIPNGQTTGDWRTDSVKTVVEEGYYALATARVLADSGRMDDLWANIHWNSRPEFVAGCNVFGRNPQSETGWAKPVTMRGGGVGVIENRHKREGLTRFAEKFFGMWERADGENKIFDGGISEVGRKSEEFKAVEKTHIETQPPYQETLLWMSDKFSLVAINQPHLDGFHLVVHPRKEYWESKGGAFKKPWQAEASISDDPEHKLGFLESLAVLKATQVILSSDATLGFSNPEIHYSGNWAKDLQPEENGGKVDPQEVARLNEEGAIDELRGYKRAVAKEIMAGMHGHLYATRDPERFVELPSRPLAEVPEEWAAIKPMTQVEVAAIKQLISEKLTNNLEKV